VTKTVRSKPWSSNSKELATVPSPYDLARHPATDGIAAEAEFLREGFVDDYHLRRSEGVGGGELAPGEESGAHGPKEPGADLGEARDDVSIGLRLEALHRDAGAPTAATEHRNHRGSHRGDTGQGAESLFSGTEERLRALSV